MSDAHPQERSQAAVLESRPPLLEMRHISKQYPGVKALDDVSFSLEHGEVHALLGENGAGKSTLIKILSGVTMADRGEIYIEGKPVVIDNPQKAMDLGISTIYQEFNLVPYLSAAENIFLGREPQGMLPGFVDFKTLYREAQQLMDRIRARFDVRTPVNQLSVAQQQMVEIAKALGRKTKILVMDEPTATLTEHEIEALFDLIRQLRSEGISVIYVSHRLEEIFEICDRATVLRDGHYVATKKVAELTRDEIIRLMVGRELKEAIPKVVVPIGPPVLRVSHLNRKGVLHDISFEVHRGEIVGLAGLVGAGRTETARAIFGADPIDSGTIEVDGKPVRIRSPRDAIRAGIGLVTEDRKQQGLVLGMAVRSNNTLSNLQALSAAGFIRLGKERSVAEKYRQELSIKTPTIEQTVKNLSGGNQQKVVLAKWLFAGAKVLILDEPTRGIDVRAKSEIYELMNELASQGVGILMISSELPEILGMSDRILVMHEGRIVGELRREEATQEKIMHLATGGE
ncbi:ABC-type sugar transport system, ATPase component [Chthonomonas calidirosea]|uniref:ABC-type sugar transport system, ATPase component n=1 Tax=Chthonomonas calidirosea (strain DSM 23976 / ICMP 18418 / T49) TaxID=1303518 RepID=S0ETT9_CHTCT|nr:sugar ABC transporter ATP-binding protein [Chthonomonas calidirosea]CCW34923.1 ABC-type sugar transport system, ATPase component [Chthonomonas calidirosea T49]CEK13407.1 ABC-type sugar transport system, ATPase component [Chthonomonas calidirosea]